MVFIAANCYAAIGLIDYPERCAAGADEACRAKLRLGALDVLAATVSRWSGARAHIAQARPGLASTLALIESHAAVAAVFKRHWPQAAP